MPSTTATARPVPGRAVGSRQERVMFFLFSNRLGCLGSVLVSGVLTLLLLLLIRR